MFLYMLAIFNVYFLLEFYNVMSCFTLISFIVYFRIVIVISLYSLFYFKTVISVILYCESGK